MDTHGYPWDGKVVTREGSLEKVWTADIEPMGVVWFNFVTGNIYFSKNIKITSAVRLLGSFDV